MYGVHYYSSILSHTTRGTCRTRAHYLSEPAAGVASEREVGLPGRPPGGHHSSIPRRARPAGRPRQLLKPRRAIKCPAQTSHRAVETRGGQRQTGPHRCYGT
jgi:hypothetical protein